MKGEKRVKGNKNALRCTSEGLIYRNSSDSGHAGSLIFPESLERAERHLTRASYQSNDPFKGRVAGHVGIHMKTFHLVIANGLVVFQNHENLHLDSPPPYFLSGDVDSIGCGFQFLIRN